MCVCIDNSGNCAYTGKPMNLNVPQLGSFCENRCGLKEKMLQHLNGGGNPYPAKQAKKPSNSAADRYIAAIHLWIDQQSKMLDEQSD